MRRWLLVDLGLAACTGRRSRPTPPERLDEAGWVLMQQVAGGWQEGNASKAVDGRADRTERPIHMTWHHGLFYPATQISAGEYTFRLSRQDNGVVMAQIRGGRNARWSESALPFEEISTAARV